MMDFDFLRAVKRPFLEFNKLGIGVVLLIIPLVNIITGFLVKGYRLESARTALNKKFEMPKWENFGSLFIKGFLSWVIWIIYMIPAIVLILIAVGPTLYNIVIQYGLNQGLSLNNQLSDQLIQNTLLQNLAMIPLFIIGLLMALLAAYLIPIATMRYMEKYRFSNAFSLGIVFKKAFTVKYFIALIAVLVYSIVISLASGGLNYGFAVLNIQFVTLIIGLIISGLATFMVMITSYTIFGEVYNKLK